MAWRQWGGGKGRAGRAVTQVPRAVNIQIDMQGLQCKSRLLLGPLVRCTGGCCAAAITVGRRASTGGAGESAETAQCATQIGPKPLLSPGVLVASGHSHFQDYFDSSSYSHRLNQHGVAVSLSSSPHAFEGLRERENVVSEVESTFEAAAGGKLRLVRPLARVRPVIRCLCAGREKQKHCLFERPHDERGVSAARVSTGTQRSSTRRTTAYS